MRITINDQTFETPFTLSGNALALATLRKQIGEARDLNSASIIFVHGTDEELAAQKEKEACAAEDRLLAAADAIRARRGEVEEGVWR